MDSDIRMPRSSGITRQILAQNAGRDSERLALKLALLRQDPFAFFRGTNPFFLSCLPRKHGLFSAPSTLVSGDLHVENFGAFKGDNRLVYFDLDDFDDACVAPFTVDVVRFLSCLEVAAGGFGLRAADAERLQAAFLSAYRAAILDGKPRWIERSLATGVFRKLLRRAMRRTRVQLLDRYGKVRDGKRTLRIDGTKTLALQTGEFKSLQLLLREFARGPDAGKRGFFELVDAARRVAGNGSLGLPRYLLLVEGRGSPNQNFVLDLKFAAPSAVAAWLPTRQPRRPHEAVRVVAVQRILQAIPPALLHAVDFAGQPYVLKELQPSIDRLTFANWRDKPRRMVEAVTGMAQVAAWAHLRGCGHVGADSVEALQAYVAREAWVGDALRVAGAAAKRMRAAWREYCEDYDAGRIAAVPRVR